MSSPVSAFAKQGRSKHGRRSERFKGRLFGLSLARALTHALFVSNLLRTTRGRFPDLAVLTSGAYARFHEAGSVRTLGEADLRWAWHLGHEQGRSIFVVSDASWRVRLLC